VQGKVEHTPRLPKGINTSRWAPKEGLGGLIHSSQLGETKKQATKRDDGRRESSKLSWKWPRATLAAMASLHG
jgi:hypothetical protein